MAEIAQLQKRSVDRMMVRIEHLDKLLSLAGEVIITSSNLHDLQRHLQEIVARQEPLTEEGLVSLKASNEAARRISQDLHELVMDIRLVEIGETLRVFRRPVRDLCRSLGREVDLRLEGGETMIDKALAERLVDPLLHLLRNAVDHGIEPPLERTRAGKPAEGVVTVQAIDREHQTEIRISDDGRGIDPESVRARAAELGLAAGEAQQPLLQLLCRPGFSTTEEVTSTSGRGVGLDLVRNVVDDFEGTLDLETAPGEGAAFILRIPKLRAVNIVDALTVRAGARLFAFPIESIVSSLGVKPGEVQSAMEQGRYIQYLGQVVILRDLQELLGGPPLGEEVDLLPVVIVENKHGRVALIVSEFLGPQKLVNVPLDETIFRVEGVAGTSVFTGGRIGLTVDVDEVVRRALGSAGETPAGSAAEMDRVLSAAREAASGPAPAEAPEPAAAETPAAEPAAAETPAAPESAAEIARDDAAELVDELRRSLTELQDALLNLEDTPGDEGAMNRAFRRLHATKGNFTMLEVEAAAELAHRMETVLDYLRGRRLEVTPERADLLLDGVGSLLRIAEALPGPAPEPAAELLERLGAEIADDDESAPAADGDLIGRTFKLTPTTELQVVSALKRGEQTFETYLRFHSGRQADFLVAYLILRRLGRHGTVLATLPSVDEIEEGQCGNAVKVLWSTPLAEEELAERLETISPQYGLREFHTIPTTIFHYEGSA